MRPVERQQEGTHRRGVFEGNKLAKTMVVVLATFGERRNSAKAFRKGWERIEGWLTGRKVLIEEWEKQEDSRNKQPCVGSSKIKPIIRRSPIVCFRRFKILAYASYSKQNYVIYLSIFLSSSRSLIFDVHFECPFTCKSRRPSVFPKHNRPQTQYNFAQTKRFQ